MTTAPIPHLHRISLRYSDLDTARHVNNTRYMSFLEDARIAFLRDLDIPSGTLAEQERSTPRYGRVLARAEIDYLVPIRLDVVPVEVRTAVEKIGASSITLHHIVSHHAITCARARWCSYRSITRRG